MKPMRPYLFRALYDWSLDNGYTPHIVVDASVDGVQVPAEFVREGRITLNIHPDAVHDFYLGDDRLAFSARFSGRPMVVAIPMKSVLGVFARETGRGMFFEDETFQPDPPDSEPRSPRTGESVKKRPGLRVVK